MGALILTLGLIVGGIVIPMFVVKFLRIHSEWGVALVRYQYLAICGPGTLWLFRK